jgi:transaldolase
VAGGKMVYTLNPEVIDDFMRICEDKDIYSQMADPVPQEIMDKLLKIPYFAASYDEDGIKIDDFINHPAFVYTGNEFSGSMKEIEEHVLARMKK